MVAPLALVTGAICLGIAVLRARTLPWWIGVALIVSCLIGTLSLPGPRFPPSDGVLFAALFAIGVQAVRAPGGTPATAVTEPDPHTLPA